MNKIAKIILRPEGGGGRRGCQINISAIWVTNALLYTKRNLVPEYVMKINLMYFNLVWGKILLWSNHQFSLKYDTAKLIFHLISSKMAS